MKTTLKLTALASALFALGSIATPSVSFAAGDPDSGVRCPAGYDAQFVTDAVGGRSEIAHLTGIERLSLAGAVPNTALGVVVEWFRDWAGPLAEPARRVTGWYLAEVPKVTDTVGIAEAEAARAQAALAAQASD